MSCAQFAGTPPFDPPIRLEQMSNLTMLTAGGRIVCKQCQATSKRTRLQCKAPAVKGKNVCRTHGGLSTGPKTEQGRAKCAEAKTVHSNSTREKRKQNAISATKLLLLRDLGLRIGPFGLEPTGWAGRKPRGYPLTDTMSAEELIEQIESLPNSRTNR
jgi:hypothetical protein